jgi:GTPase SAR1 family protein
MREEELEIAIKVRSCLLKSLIKIFNRISATFQVVIVGNGGVGKSSMIQRYCKGIYTKDYKKTIGVDFLERLIE